MSGVIKTLTQKPLALFVTTTCPFCIGARNLAASKGVKPAVVELDREENGAQLRKELTELTKQRTVPYVFSKGQFIGGASDLSKKDDTFWNNIK